MKEIVDHISSFNGDQVPLEVTLEANPMSIKRSDKSLLQDFRESGVNRMSIGVQSFDDSHLTFLEREHGSKEAIETIEHAKKVFGERVSFDLMFSIPLQTVNHWREQLKTAKQLEPSHISLYQLTLEKSTKLQRQFERNEISFPSEEESAEMFEAAIESCKDMGMDQYEVSNFAKSGMESVHNLCYWNYECYLGCGPGAHSRLWKGNEDGYQVYSGIETPDPSTWMMQVESTSNGLRHMKKLSSLERAEEYLLMGLRTREGVDLSPKALQEKTGQFTEFGDIVNIATIHQLSQQGFVDWKDSESHLKVTKKGMMVLDTITSKIIK